MFAIYIYMFFLFKYIYIENNKKYLFKQCGIEFLNVFLYYQMLY